jgi:hypothetical protein
MTDDYYLRRASGVRQPDPTLGKRYRQQPGAPEQPQEMSRERHERAIVESVPPAPGEEKPKPEHHAKPRRERVILADPKRVRGTLRARVELEEQTSWGKLLVTDLVKIQLKTALWLGALVVGVLGTLPVLFYLVPSFAALTVAGIPVAWLILGVAPFPFLFGIGLWYNLLAERHERDFVDMIEN